MTAKSNNILQLSKGAPMKPYKYISPIFQTETNQKVPELCISANGINSSILNVQTP